jgi:5-methyltetrahydrofolate--homocysteine methyltransferase
MAPWLQARAPKIDWSDPANAPVPPAVPGTQVLLDVSIEEVVPYIDWNPFFQARSLRFSIWNNDDAKACFRVQV